MYNFTLDAAITAWLAQPRIKRAHIAHEPTLHSFRDALQREGLDLLSNPTDVARVVESWASTFIPKRSTTNSVSRYAYNHRLVLLSDFYTFLNDHYTPVPPLIDPAKLLRGEYNQPVFAFDMDGPWGRCLSHFLQSLKTPNTRYRYSLTLSHFFSIPPRKMPDEYSRADCLDFIHSSMTSARSQGKPLAPSAGTINFRLAALAAYYSFAATYTYTDENGQPQLLMQRPFNPTSGIKHVKRGEPRPKAMSLDEIKRFFAAIDASPARGGSPIKAARDKCIYGMYLMTTRRKSAIARLTWGSITRGDDCWLYSFTEKGRFGEVETLELPETCAQALLEYLRISGRLETIKPSDPLFTALDSARPLNSGVIARNFKTICTQAGLDPGKFSLHSWRHSGIQQRLQLGQDMFDVMKISGHKSLDVFYRYARRLTGARDEFAPVLEKRFDFLGVK